MIGFAPVAVQFVLLCLQEFGMNFERSLEDHENEDHRVSAGKQQDLDVVGDPADGHMTLVAEPIYSEHSCFGVCIVNRL